MSEQESKQSLASLTQSFIELLKASPGQPIEISTVETKLKANKRRLYDVINVLCGVGLIERCGKSQLLWTNHVTESYTPISKNVLLQEEKEIDEMTAIVDQALEALPNTEEFKQNAWLSPEDIELLDPQRTLSLFALHGPPSMTIQIFEDDEEEGNHRMVCQSADGKIQFFEISIH